MSSKQKGILLASGLGLFLVFLDAMIANLALPDIQNDFGGGESTMQWIVVAYSVGMAVGIMPAGTIADRDGRRRLFFISVALFTIASFLAGISQGLWMLVAARGLQGVAAAAISVTSLAIVSTAFPQAKEKAKAIGLWNAIAAVGLAVGPILGGILTQELNWRSVFFISVPVGLLVLYLTSKFVDESRNPRYNSFDRVGQLLFVIAIGSLATGVVLAPRNGWLSPSTIALFVAFIVSFAAFIRYERKQKSPMVDLSLFLDKKYSWSIAAIFITFSMAYGALLLTTQYFQNIRDFSPIEAGFGLLPFAFVMMLLPPKVGKYAARVGPLKPALFGVLICAIAAFVMALSYEVHFATPLSIGLLGIGIGFAGPSLTALSMSSVRKERAGMAASIFSAQRALGSTIGYAVMGSLLVAVLNVNLNPSLRSVVPDDTQREAIANSIITNANPSAFIAEIGPGEPIPSETPANEAEILEVADDDFIRGLQISMAVGGSFVVLLYLYGRNRLTQQ